MTWLWLRRPQQNVLEVTSKFILHPGAGSHLGPEASMSPLWGGWIPLTSMSLSVSGGTSQHGGLHLARLLVWCLRASEVSTCSSVFSD